MERLTERAEVDKCPGIWVKEGFANDGLRTWFNGYDEGYSAIDKCAEYEDAEEQGLLLRLPCRVGDSVFKIIDECDLPGDCYTKLMCKGCEYRNLYVEEEIISSNREAVLVMGYIGKTVFLTREEAEQELAEMKGEKFGI